MGSKEFHRSREFAFSLELVVQLLRHRLNVRHWLTPLARCLSRPLADGRLHFQTHCGTHRFQAVLRHCLRAASCLPLFETHGFLSVRHPMKSPIDALSRPQWGTSLRGMSDQTSEAFAYIRREYNDVKGRVELQRHVVATAHGRSRSRRGRSGSQRIVGSWTTCESG